MSARPISELVDELIQAVENRRLVTGAFAEGKASRSSLTYRALLQLRREKLDLVEKLREEIIESSIVDAEVVDEEIDSFIAPNDITPGMRVRGRHIHTGYTITGVVTGTPKMGRKFITLNDLTNPVAADQYLWTLVTPDNPNLGDEYREAAERVYLGNQPEETVTAVGIRNSQPGSTFRSRINQTWEWDGEKLACHTISGGLYYSQEGDLLSIIRGVGPFTRSTAAPRGDYRRGEVIERNDIRLHDVLDLLGEDGEWREGIVVERETENHFFSKRLDDDFKVIAKHESAPGRSTWQEIRLVERPGRVLPDSDTAIILITEIDGYALNESTLARRTMTDGAGWVPVFGGSFRTVGKDTRLTSLGAVESSDITGWKPARIQVDEA